jgi:hypothetical protein
MDTRPTRHPGCYQGDANTIDLPMGGTQYPGCRMVQAHRCPLPPPNAAKKIASVRSTDYLTC